MKAKLEPMTWQELQQIEDWVEEITDQKCDSYGPEFLEEMNKRCIKAGLRVSNDDLMAYYQSRKEEIEEYSLKMGWHRQCVPDCEL